MQMQKLHNTAQFLTLDFQKGAFMFNFMSAMYDVYTFKPG